LRQGDPRVKPAEFSSQNTRLEKNYSSDASKPSAIPFRSHHIYKESYLICTLQARRLIAAASNRNKVITS
jgi:hypothetical protein